jgi:hypothetical protein
MKTLLTATVLSFVCVSSAYAQCYGEAAQAFGCGISRGQESGLETFGDAKNEVVPDYGYGYARHISAEDLFTHQERIHAYRRIYRGNARGNRWSEQAFRNSVTRGNQPVRTFGNLPFAAPRF